MTRIHARSELYEQGHSCLQFAVSCPFGRGAGGDILRTLWATVSVGGKLGLENCHHRGLPWQP